MALETQIAILLTEATCKDAGPLLADVDQNTQDNATNHLNIFEASVAYSVIHEMVEPKYWAQRKRFFYLWDYGVRMDHTAWYSVTPEALSRHHALRCTRIIPWEYTRTAKLNALTILDACCGVGGNTIQFALKGFNVIAFDNRVDTLELVSSISGISWT
jgi:2-polyprenyl-3-methyl-5-hydroxy-6-metoxy-1,4-benzoquinol methylase